MLARFLQPLPWRASRRAYSIFSSKPGGGRYFNSAKPHKVSPAATTAGSTAKAKANVDDGSPSPPSSCSPPSSEDGSSHPLVQEDAPPAVSSQPQPHTYSSRSSPSPAPQLPPHPTFSIHTYPLHHFFSLHRPLLLLPLTTSTLFETPSTPFDEATSSSPPDTSATSFDDTPETPADADADAARQLARALAVNRVGGWIDWEETLARLGDVESLRILAAGTSSSGDCSDVNVNLDSTKRKRRKKMSKHKYKKRRRLQRSERRKMGK